MQWTAWTTIASLLVYGWIFYNVGKARIKYQVKAPSMEGPRDFQSAYRVQANTVEQMVLYLPALWLCASFLGDRWAAAGGALWIVGRIMYAVNYYRDPATRGPGFMINLAATFALLVGAGVGLLMRS